MVDIAVVRVAEDSLEVLVCDDRGLSTDLALLGLEMRQPSRWSGHLSVLEPVCSLFDRHGVHWGVYAAASARTFAERLFAECPAELAGDLYEAVRSVLARCAAATLELAALDSAWRSHGGGSLHATPGTG